MRMRSGIPGEWGVIVIRQGTMVTGSAKSLEWISEELSYSTNAWLFLEEEENDDVLDYFIFHSSWTSAELE